MTAKALAAVARCCLNSVILAGQVLDAPPKPITQQPADEAMALELPPPWAGMHASVAGAALFHAAEQAADRDGGGGGAGAEAAGEPAASSHDVGSKARQATDGAVPAEQSGAGGSACGSPRHHADAQNVTEPIVRQAIAVGS